jgi:SET domain-containing protein
MGTFDYRPDDWMDPRIEVRPSPIHTQGMFAAAPIRQGEVVNIWGGTLLLTEKDIAGSKKSEWRAGGYAWATIGEGLYLARPLGEDRRDPTNFINHSCDPNVWMQDEVTLVARRNIAVDEELTVDYAMFEGDEDWVGRFECRCSSHLCRGGLTGKDWRRTDLQQRYGQHFSPFINQRIRQPISSRPSPASPRKCGSRDRRA